MSDKPHAATILKWLKDNGHRLGGLTSHDTRALLASVQIVALWDGSPLPSDIAKAWGAVVRQMQPAMQQMAFHGVAHVYDWGLRFSMWRAAEMPGVMPSPCYRCKFGPQHSAEAAAVSLAV